jgi:hypothetical protein
MAPGPNEQEAAFEQGCALNMSRMEEAQKIILRDARFAGSLKREVLAGFTQISTHSDCYLFL